MEFGEDKAKIFFDFEHFVPLSDHLGVHSLFHRIVISSLVCIRLRVYVYPCGVCIEVWPSHTTSAETISAARAAVEAPIYALHHPLPVSKPVLSSWSLVVICPLIAPDATGITDWYDNRLVVPEVPLYKFENIGYLQGTRAPPVCYVLVSRMYLSLIHI